VRATISDGKLVKKISSRDCCLLFQEKEKCRKTQKHNTTQITKNM